MNYGKMIREWREKKRWTQRELANAMGCSDGYIAHLESQLKLPSVEICLALAEVLELPYEKRQELLNAVEEIRHQRSETRVRTRGTLVRGALRTGGTISRQSSGIDEGEYNAEEIARDMNVDKDLKTAYRNLRVAMSDPNMRETVLNALRAFAQIAQKKND